MLAVYIVIIAVVLLLPVLLSYLCYLKTFYVSPNKFRDPHTPLDNDQFLSLWENTIQPILTKAEAVPYEDVYINSLDGLRLHGYYYEKIKGAPVEIMFHGYRSIAIRDFCGALQFTLESGHNVLLVDQRAHGKSEGKCLSFGVNERNDCVLWAKYAAERFGQNTPIILVGVSMGAATVLMASELDLPENVVGIVADSSYSSPEAIIKKTISEMHLPVKISYFFANTGARIFGGFDLSSSSAIDAVKNTKLPVLLFHGESDTFVPCEMSREIYNVCNSPKMLVTVAGSDHGLEYLIDKDKYMNGLEEFKSKVVNV